MRYAILCEGKTDAILLSYYMHKVYGWKFDRNTERRVKLDLKNKKSGIVSWYKREGRELLIAGVGGKNCFDSPLESILEINKIDADEAFEKKVILSDRDKSEEDSTVLEEFNKIFNKYCGEIKLINNGWSGFHMKDGFGSAIQVDVASIIVPFEKEGALETFLLDALSEEVDLEYIVRKSRDFIKTIESKYLRSDRLKLKAELGVTLAIMSPEKVFTPLDDIFKEINWEKYSSIQKSFSILGDLIK